MPVSSKTLCGYLPTKKNREVEKPAELIGKPIKVAPGGY